MNVVNQRISLKLVDLGHSINSKIRNLVKQGHYKAALYLHSQNPLCTSKFTYPSLLKAIATLSLLHHGQILHSTIITNGLQSDPFISTSLIKVYVECASLDSAVHVFDEMRECKDVTFWNSMIDGYFQFGRFKDGLTLFRQMQVLGIRPDVYTLCFLLRNCNGHVGFMEIKSIHGFSVRNLFKGDKFLETGLVDAYFRCGRVSDAWCLFRRCKNEKNVVLWNVVIKGFCENGFLEEGLEVYLLAKREDVKIESASFVVTLSGCGQGEFGSFGMQVHSDVIKMGVQDDVYVCASLLTMYAKCKLIEDAEKVFILVSHKTIELWNAMVSAYVGRSLHSYAFHVYKEMTLSRILPGPFTLLNILASCTVVGLYEFGTSVHAGLIKRPIGSDIAVLTALLTFYSRFGRNHDANMLFYSMPERDVVSWGSMISGLCQNKRYNEALETFKEMQKNRVKPDSGTIVAVVSACTGLDSAVLGCVIHGFVIRTGLEMDNFVACSMLDMYAKCGVAEMAERVFSHLPHKNIVAWNSMIFCYSRNDLPELSIKLFSYMARHVFDPDSVTISTVLRAVSSLAALLKGKTLHGYLLRRSILCDIQVENALIDMYIKCGLLKYAECIFSKMTHRNLVTWNLLIAGYGSHGESSKALQLMDEMKNSGITPDDITFLSLLSSCNHSGLIEEALDLFESMKVKYGFTHRMEHYTNVVDLLGRAGRLYDAYTIIENMPTEPDRSVWLSLLCSCRAHGNLELGELAADKLLKIEPSRGSNYIQLLNLYREAELWDEVAELQASMKEQGLKKNPGCSWIELKNRVDIFLSGDCSSAMTVEIHDALRSLRENMITKQSNYDSLEAI